MDTGGFERFTSPSDENSESNDGFDSAENSESSDENISTGRKRFSDGSLVAVRRSGGSLSNEESAPTHSTSRSNSTITSDIFNEFDFNDAFIQDCDATQLKFQQDTLQSFLEKAWRKYYTSLNKVYRLPEVKQAYNSQIETHCQNFSHPSQQIIQANLLNPGASDMSAQAERVRHEELQTVHSFKGESCCSCGDCCIVTQTHFLDLLHYFAGGLNAATRSPYHPLHAPQLRPPCSILELVRRSSLAEHAQVATLLLRTHGVFLSPAQADHGEVDDSDPLDVVAEVVGARSMEESVALRTQGSSKTTQTIHITGL
jgi:hypothetical protein